MILCRVDKPVVATVKDLHLRNQKILVCRPVAPDGHTVVGTSFLAVDRVRAGEGDLVLVVNEGSSARLVFENPKIPLTAFIAAVVDGLEIRDSLAGQSCVERSIQGKYTENDQE